MDDISLSIETEIALCSTGISKNELYVVDNMKFEDKIQKEKGSITVCYLGDGEGIWEVAKRYHVSVDRIMSANAISNGSIQQDYLII